MFWYVLLMFLVAVFVIVAIGAFLISILSGCEIPEVLLVTLVAGIIAFGMGFGATSIKNANTTINTTVEQMEITKCYIMENNCYIAVKDKYVIKVSFEKYACLNVGDVVLVEVTIKTTFGEEQKPEITLKG